MTNAQFPQPDTTRRDGIHLVFRMEACLGLSYSVLLWKFGYLKNSNTSLWNISQNMDLEKIFAIAAR